MPLMTEVEGSLIVIWKEIHINLLPVNHFCRVDYQGVDLQDRCYHYCFASGNGSAQPSNFQGLDPHKNNQLHTLAYHLENHSRALNDCLLKLLHILMV